MSTPANHGVPVLLTSPDNDKKRDDQEWSTLVFKQPKVIKTPCLFLRCLTVTIFIVGATQYVYGIVHHSSLISIQFAASALAFISSTEIIFNNSAKKENGQSVFLLYRTAATVFYIACLFLNLTHCLEDVSDINASKHEENEIEDSHEHPVTYKTLYISIADLFIKTIFGVTYNALSVHCIVNFFALVSPAVLTILVFFHDFFNLDLFFSWLNHHLEPIASILLTVLCISIAIYSLIRKKQFLLAEGPKYFKIDKISESVKAQNGSLEKVDHVHASCEWPEGFTVSLKAYIKVDKNNKDWVSQAANDYSELKDLLHIEIKAQGAKEVIVEPVFVDRNELTDIADPICISRSCHNEDVGCCTNPKTSVEV